MPVERIPVSVSQFCELLALDPARFVGVDVDRAHSTITILQKPNPMSDEFLIPPPSNVTVEHEHRVRLWTADGQPLVRRAGFRPSAIQTTGTNPPLSDNTRRKPKRGGKKGC